MHRFLMIVAAGLILFSCGTQRQLQRTYIGQPVTTLNDNFGQPVSIIDREQEKVYIFEEEEELKRTEINQGKLTLDPIVTPKVLKTKRYYFTVKNGKISAVKFEEEYDR